MNSIPNQTSVRYIVLRIFHLIFSRDRVENLKWKSISNLNWDSLPVKRIPSLWVSDVSYDEIGSIADDTLNGFGKAIDIDRKVSVYRKT